MGKDVFGARARRGTGRSAGLIAGALATGALCGPAAAQSQWDAVISGSHWYVGVPNMLAYASSNTSFAQPIPVGDQTLWALGTSTNGVFTGSSSAELAIGPITSPSSMSISGVVTPSGQITMLFTDPSTGLTTVGLGMMREMNGVTTMEMQMITGTSLLVTHWAYMLPYDPATFTPPAPQVVPSNASPQWAWTQGTPWRVTSPTLFGTAAPGRFIITDYKSGYFWGQGVAPNGSTFTLIGSITPEGKVLYSTLPDADPKLTTLYGEVTGSAEAAEMLLGVYDSSGTMTGEFAWASLVQPYAQTLRATGTPAPLGAARVLYAVAGTPAGLFGPLAPAIAALDAFEGPALSAALSQTLPPLAGSAARATYDTQRGLRQIVSDRLATRGDTADPDRPDAWLQPFGAFASQTAQAGYSGFNASGGGFVAGIDRPIGGDLVLGGMAAYSDMALSGTAVGAPSSLGLTSYALGLYGSYAPLANLALDVEIDGAFNANAESRLVGLAAATARADYDSYTFHAGAGVRPTLAVTPDLTLQPVLRLDYASVSAQAYTESGAGALNLAVDGQTYQELLASGALGGTYRLSAPLSLTAHAGVGYNLLDTGTRATAAFLGGGTRFVTAGADLSPWLFTAGAGLTAGRTAGLDLRVGYDLQVSPSGFLNQMGSLSLRMSL
ncbi:autotransporter outer membrane beta-barrel domain-containing protein [Xanthobacter sp. V4C-4]|uniref:autotransporter family protein n=1 Tax=Xanthobacter cornucopiae TaxID=3119924 RepID=UPI003729D656